MQVIFLVRVGCCTPLGEACERNGDSREQNSGFHFFDNVAICRNNLASYKIS